VIIRRIHEFAEDDLDLMKFMIDNGIVPGANAKIVDVLPFNQTVTLVVSGKHVTLGYSAARYIFAETE
jgi:Fe2+ transport system protein FeoA